MYKTYTVGARKIQKQTENIEYLTGNGCENITTQHFPQWTTTPEWNHMAVTDNDVMKLEMCFL